MADTSSVSGMICIGAIAGARGVKGDVRIKSFTGEPGAVADYGTVSDETGGRTFRIRVTGLGTGKALGMVFARLDGVNDRDAAEALKGTRLYVARSALPEPSEDEFYHADLVGVRADLVDGGTLGVIREVHDFGAGTVLEIAGEQAGIVMVPFTRAAVPIVDLASGRVVIDPPVGLLEPATPPDQEAEGAEDDRK